MYGESDVKNLMAHSYNETTARNIVAKANKGEKRWIDTIERVKRRYGAKLV